MALPGFMPTVGDAFGQTRGTGALSPGLDFAFGLIDVQYDRNDYDRQRGMFRVRGDVVDVFPPYAENPLRIEFFVAACTPNTFRYTADGGT